MAYKDYDDQARANEEGAARRSISKRDISTGMPPVGNLARRKACERNLQLFCETYFRSVYVYRWSVDHIKILRTTQEVILDGGLFAEAMPRGSGKTVITATSVLWALLYRLRRFIEIISSTQPLGVLLMKNHIKNPLMNNDLLLEDFRHVCYPIRRLENNSKRCVGQLFREKPTQISWEKNTIVFPTMPDDVCDGLNVSGSTVYVAGLTGAVRGPNITTATGESLRPDFVVLDDPQTRESAKSLSQTNDRESIILGDVLGLAGPGKTIAAVMPCTVIQKDDLSDRFLDRKKRPEWNGILTKTLYAFPKNMKLWDQYSSMIGRKKEATEFYRANRKVMDEGAIVAWDDRVAPGELSALQNAMNLYYQSPDMFFAEYQNDPVEKIAGDSPVVPKERIVKKLNGLKRGVCPVGAEYVTCFVDVHKEALFYVAVAWNVKFGGAIIDYGTYPEQNRRHFTLAGLTQTLGQVGPKGAGEDGYIFAGLMKLTDMLCGRAWEREDGKILRVKQLLMDRGYKAKLVELLCRQSSHAAVIFPSAGQAVKASNKPIAEYNRKLAGRIGFHWWIPTVTRHLRMDINYWKTFIHSRLATAEGDVGSLSLWGHDETEHELFAEHLNAETAVRVYNGSTAVDEYRQTQGRDNHWFDGIVGCAAGASMNGLTLAVPGARSGVVRVMPKRKAGGVRYL